MGRRGDGVSLKEWSERRRFEREGREEEGEHKGKKLARKKVDEREP